METLRLSNGVILRYRPIPPYATSQAFQSLQDPPPPKVELESAAGHTEEVPADEDSAAYQDWIDETHRVRMKRVEMMQSLALDYGIVDWLLPPPSGLKGAVVRLLRLLGIENWRDAPPRGWTIPETLTRHGVGEYINRRLTYIQLELIETTEDLERVMRIVGLGRRGEVTEEEVKAAEASFRDDVGRGAAARPAVPADQGEGADSGGDRPGEEVGA